MCIPSVVAKRYGALVAVGAFVAGAAQAQQPAAIYNIEPKSSLAWWQVNPNLNHLWATTCPADPSWLPGEGRSPGPGISERNMTPSQEDTIHIPLFVREHPRPVCAEAVQGSLTTADTVHWNGVRARVVVDARLLVTGEKERDVFARNAVLEADKYPQITFAIDSLTRVIRSAKGDTVRATAVGTLGLHGTTTPLSVPIVATREPDGWRVRGRWFMTSDELWSKYQLSKQAMALGVGMGIWKQLWMGVDLVLRPAGP